MPHLSIVCEQGRRNTPDGGSGRQAGASPPSRYSGTTHRDATRRGTVFAWNQIDFGRGLILVQRTKTGRDRINPMNSTVKETLAAIRQQAESDQVFPINDV